MGCIDDVRKRLTLNTDDIYWAMALCSLKLDPTLIVQYIEDLHNWQSILAEAEKLGLSLTDAEIQALLEAIRAGKDTKPILEKFLLKKQALEASAKSATHKNN